jgi:hypothetical protein
LFMLQTLRDKNATIRDLIDQFGLQSVEEDDFFPEWQEDLPEITEQEKQFLNKVKEGYWNLLESPPLLGKPIQIAILGPMLFLGNFFLPPFRIQAECSIEISVEDEGDMIYGQLDILRIKERLWVMAIESERFSFSTIAGYSQLIGHMLFNLPDNKPGYGLVVTGGQFLFIKLINNEVPKYALSNTFCTFNGSSELYKVFRILKRIGQI